jgi:photosystem II stability/assembly factor-like uncharacterized protein
MQRVSTHARPAGIGFVVLVLALALPLSARAGEAATTPLAPQVWAAAQVGHAARATMLATARAGTRIVAVGDRGIVLLSDDGGRTHRQAKAVPVDATLTSVSFVDEKLGWATGHWGVVLHTTDGGETWRSQRLDTAQDRPLFAIHFFDARHGVAVGLWSLVIVTDDGGKTWTPVTLAAPDGGKKADLNLLGLFAGPHGRLFAAGERGMVLRSDDRGQHWTYLPTGYKGSFWTGLATSDGSLLAAGLRGSMYRSTDNGSTWSRVDTHSTSSITGLAQQDGQVLGIGLDGLLLRSSDNGASFQRSVRNDRAALTALVLNAAGPPILYSRHGVLSLEGEAK